MGGGFRGLEAAALIDGDVHQHRTGTHELQLFARDQLRRRGARDQHRADHQIGVGQTLFDGVVGRIDRGQLVAVDLVEIFQAIQRAVEDGDVRIQAHRHARGVDADHAAADHQHFRRLHAGHAAQQHAGATLRFFQRVRAGLDRHASGHFAHRRQQRQAALAIGDGFIGDRCAAGFDQAFGLRRIGREVKIGVQQLAFAQHRDLDRLRFLDLDDHFGATEDFLRGIDDFGAGLLVHLVRQTDGFSAIALHHHLVAVADEFARAGRSQADAVLVVFDFLGDADQHDWIPWIGWMARIRRSGRSHAQGSGKFYRYARGSGSVAAIARSRRRSPGSAGFPRGNSG